MEYEYQIISLPLGSSTVARVMPMPQSEGDYDWRVEAGANTVLMHFIRLGWEPVSPLGIVDGTVSLLLRKRLATSMRGGH